MIGKISGGAQWVLLLLLTPVLAQLSAKLPGKAAVDSTVLGFLPAMWEVQMEFSGPLASDCSSPKLSDHLGI